MLAALRVLHVDTPPAATESADIGADAAAFGVTLVGGTVAGRGPTHRDSWVTE
jgi:hypothetical protein